MKTLVLAEGVASTVAAQAGVALVATPFLAGRDVVGCIDLTGVTGSPVAKIQGSDDVAFTTPVDLMTSSILGLKKGNFKLMKYMRFNITTAGTGGVASAYCDNGA
jgi:hypothetical protein